MPEVRRGTFRSQMEESMLSQGKLPHTQQQRVQMANQQRMLQNYRQQPLPHAHPGQVALRVRVAGAVA